MVILAVIQMVGRAFVSVADVAPSLGWLVGADCW